MISLNYGFTALASPIFRQSMSNHSERYREKNACTSAGRGQNERGYTRNTESEVETIPKAYHRNTVLAGI